MKALIKKLPKEYFPTNFKVKGKPQQYVPAGPLKIAGKLIKAYENKLQKKAYRAGTNKLNAFLFAKPKTFIAADNKQYKLVEISDRKQLIKMAEGRPRIGKLIIEKLRNLEKQDIRIGEIIHGGGRQNLMVVNIDGLIIDIAQYSQNYGGKLALPESEIEAYYKKIYSKK